VVRFRFDLKSGRMAHNGDPVVDAQGQVVGEVTCCSIDTDGFRSGQAYLGFAAGAEGTPVLVYQGTAEAFAKASPPPATRAELEAALAAAGVKVRAPEAATVLSRFPRKKSATL
jgi:glycine hydroxymethyltransferase